MRKLHLNTEDLCIESFTTSDAEPARRGTVRAQGTPFTNAGQESCGIDECDGYSSRAGHICYCDTTYTQLGPECDPSEQTLCVGNTLCEW